MLILSIARWIGSWPPWDFSTMPFRCLLQPKICPEPVSCWPFLRSLPVACSPWPRRFTAASVPPFTDCAQLWLLMFCWRFCGSRGGDAQRVFAGRTGSPRRPDRMPEVKTLRRKLARLAALKGSYRLGREIAGQRITGRGKVLGFLYIDGHVRAYHGKHQIPKAYVCGRTPLS